MATQPAISRIFVGKHDRMVAEVGAFDFRDGRRDMNELRWTLMCDADVQMDTECFTTKADAMSVAREYAEVLGVPVCFIA
jgi:hypothetical protein